MPEAWRPDKIRAIFDANIVIEQFPKEMFFYIFFADEKIHPDLVPFIQRRDASFVLCHGDEALASGRTPEISEAMEKQFNPTGKKL
jgi:hypothetical protein